MPVEERRELVLAAATHAFAVGGYAGTSTDTIAREAGVSQPYVVRMFGTKLELFVGVLDRACGRIEAAFAAVLDDGRFDPEDEQDADRLGHAYTELLADSDLLHVMMHGFSAASVPEIGAVARDRMARIFTTLQRTGWTDEQVRDFIAHGMLLNVLLSMDAFRVGGGPLADLVRSCLPDSWTDRDTASAQAEE
jgi:AcrR family transcriptional regulator